MSDPELTFGRYPVPEGQQCQWPSCTKGANGSVAVGSEGKDRLYLCLEHLQAAAQIGRDGDDSKRE